jgi:hypothetical protein
MRNRTRLRRNSAVLMVAWCATSFATDFASVGPVDQVLPGRNELKVLGQTYKVAAPNQVAGLDIGDHAIVVGRLDADGRLIATELRKLPTKYVPGSSQVYVRGKISLIDFANGRLTVGDSVIQISGVADVAELNLASDVELEVLGTQPQPSGLILATALVVVSTPSTVDLQSVTGTGRLSVTGTGKQSVTGTGKQSVTGTGKQSVTGTGKLSVTGTGMQSVTGTGSLSVTGTGRQSVTGTGMQSVTGTGSLSVTGTGKQSVTGTGALSVTGTGKQSVTGTGSH